jgi:hypothetical protein
MVPRRSSSVVVAAQQQGVDLVHRLGAGLDRTAAGEHQRSQRPYWAAAVLGNGGGVAGEHRSSRGISVDRVALSPAAASGPVRSADLDHQDPGRPQTTRQPVAEAAGPFDACCSDPTVSTGPGQQLLGRGVRRAELGDCQVAAQRVQDRGDVHVLMCVDAKHDIPGLDPHPRSFLEVPSRASGQDTQRAGQGSYRVTARSTPSSRKPRPAADRSTRRQLPPVVARVRPPSPTSAVIILD